MFKRFFERHADDILILTGAGLVIYATLQLSWIAALYVTGAFCIVGGVLVGLGGKR